MFSPSNRLVSDWYIHYKTYEGDSIEETKPYIGEVFIAEGASREEALRNLLSNNPDGFVDYNLNSGTNGKYIYIGYKRTDNGNILGAAITDMVILQSTSPAKAHFVDASDEISIRYDLVSLVNLNSGNKGDGLYLYVTKRIEAGNLLSKISVSNTPDISAEDIFVTAGIRDGAYTNEAVNLNAGANAEAIYLTMKKSAPKVDSEEAPPTQLEQPENVASMIGEGSEIAVLIFIVAIATLVLITVLIKKKKANK